jgi:hypothetical protein
MKMNVNIKVINLITSKNTNYRDGRTLIPLIYRGGNRRQDGVKAFPVDVSLPQRPLYIFIELLENTDIELSRKA